MLSNEEKQQYNRHLILDEIGTQGQEKLKAAKVLVIGAGGLGCPVLQYLTAAGVGTIGVIDNDVVDQSNLQRQILYTIDDIGKPKAEVAVARLSKLNPFVFFKTYVEKLDIDNAIDTIESYDIVVDGSDNFPTRYLVNDACVLADKPLVFGSIFKFQGQVTVFNYKGGPTYRCLFPDPPAPDTVPNCSAIGVLGVLPGIIGSLQANEVIKMITGIGQVLDGKLMYMDTLTMEQQIVNFQKNEELTIAVLATDYDFFCGIGIQDTNIVEISAEALEKDREQYEVLDVRTVAEFEQFNIGGIHIPLDELSARIKTIITTKPLVVCCQTGIRSKRAIEILSEERDDLEVLNLRSGLLAYPG